MMTIRIRLAVFISIALLVILLLAIFAGKEQTDLYTNLYKISDSSTELIRLTEQIDNRFQKQLFSWSNLLLRGENSDEYYRNLQVFYQHERETRHEIKTMTNKLEPYPIAQQEMKAFGESHELLGVRFRKALKIYNQSDDPIYDTDRYLWDAVEDPIRLLAQVKTSIIKQREEQLEKAEKEFERSKEVIISIALTMVVVFAASFVWLMDSSMGKPFSQIIKRAEKIADGDYSQRVAENMPGEFNLFARAINRMIESLMQTNKHLQQNMQVLQDEIAMREKLELELEQKQHAAEEASRAKSEFLSTMSHEIRTPLNVVTGFAELLEMTEATDKQKNYIKSIQSGSASLLNIINDVLDLTKIESGKLTLDYGMFDLFELLDDIELMFRKQSYEKGLSFYVSKSQSVPRNIVLDKYRLKQVLVNLVSNAVKFTEQGSIKIVVDVVAASTPGNTGLSFSVEDTGIGIPQEYHQKIFNQFEQRDGQDSRKYGGTGLGLAISQNLAHLLNGNLTVSSEPGQGSVFVLVLHDVETVGEISVNHDAVEQPIQRLNPSKILVVDDMQANRELIAHYLDGHPVEFVEAENGISAIEAAHQHMPDLILMDIMMPEMDGVEATQIIKADVDLQNIPVVALTASSIKGQDTQLKESLFDDYLTKPIKINSLINSLSRFL